MADRIPGSSWSNPIWHRRWRIYVAECGPYAYAFAHDDFDGDGDSRAGYARSVDEARAEIDEREGFEPANDAPRFLSTYPDSFVA